MPAFDLESFIGQNLVKKSVETYQPHEKQEIFHRATHKAKLYIGGNRSGKTVGGIVEDIYWLKGEHPFRRVPPPPVYGRIVTTDFDDGLEKIIFPEIKKWMPLSLLKNGSWEDSYKAKTKMLHLTNGSTVEFMTYKQMLEDFAGASRHFIHFDEEPPEDIFTECKARLVDTGGSYWITMTPVQGVTWTHDKLYEPNYELSVEEQKVLIIEVDMTENPHLNQTEIDFFLDGLDDNEKKARKQGKFVSMTGLIFPMFDPQIHVIDSMIPNQNWKLYLSMDSGINHPTAFTWTAVSPKNICITFREHHRADWTIEKHAKRVFEIQDEIGGWKPDLITGDPSIRQRSVETGFSIQIAYRKLGIAIKPPVNRDVETGISRMQSYLTHGPRWFITKDCPNLIKEMRKWRWQQWESKKLQTRNAPKRQPVKKDDDAIDSVRYVFTFMPDLTPQVVAAEGNIRDIITAGHMLNAKHPTRFITARDIRRMNAPGRRTEWKVIDE